MEQIEVKSEFQILHDKLEEKMCALTQKISELIGMKDLLKGSSILELIVEIRNSIKHLFLKVEEIAQIVIHKDNVEMESEYLFQLIIQTTMLENNIDKMMQS